MTWSAGLITPSGSSTPTQQVLVEEFASQSRDGHTSLLAG